MGMSENSVPHCTQWLMTIIPINWLFHWEYTLFSDKPTCGVVPSLGMMSPGKPASILAPIFDLKLPCLENRGHVSPVHRFPWLS